MSLTTDVRLGPYDTSPPQGRVDAAGDGPARLATGTKLGPAEILTPLGAGGMDEEGQSVSRQSSVKNAAANSRRSTDD